MSSRCETRLLGEREQPGRDVDAFDVLVAELAKRDAGESRPTCCVQYPTLDGDVVPQGGLLGHTEHRSNFGPGTIRWDRDRVGPLADCVRRLVGG